MSDVSSHSNFLLNFYYDIQVTRYCQLAASSIIALDHMVTFDEEVNLIWISAPSLGKVVFLMSRYYMLAAMIVNLYAFFNPALTDELYVGLVYTRNILELI
ncbi:hypothetical protein GALMADRAFT_1052870 [Galerina marginata CBS 339.88]|uniref:DUF6533 domain-containing protein n=1 Tax=Galerina marginata (strain CBS 339.88) TaxID=685588 RepID=A0A067SKB6_GALM3|nr:hypothetical protein GALMADRAFT_1052870 [Galerina marginata CBS 339.88]